MTLTFPQSVAQNSALVAHSVRNTQKAPTSVNKFIVPGGATGECALFDCELPV
ncbi:hypothetical protein [Sporosarcina sp. BP05]|uniref:hypothetical protein n=1 Tax=Sporosarcina sp. BP05 TaxID=2758726 RepID=UPI001645AF4A|nr:hypothetical protein [Sporosarcina sp. BP05]